MFEVTRDAVQVWLNNVEVFDVGVGQVNDWVESGRLDRFYPRQAGKYVVVMAGSYYGRNDWVCLHEPDGPRVLALPACDTLLEAMEEVRFQVGCDLFTEVGTRYGYDYEIWHLCDDDALYVEPLLSCRPRFMGMGDLVQYVKKSLGDFAPEFDCLEIAQDVSLYVNGWFYIVKDADDYWRCVASHALA